MNFAGKGGRKQNARCSFCRRSALDAGPLVEGPGHVFICSDCVEHCQQTLDQERERRSVPKGVFAEL
jgi:ATP-dependent Clp protease ATP-binding subunit ClpX